MKIIINESQLRLIVENEEKKDNLINFTPFYKGGFPPEEWDDMFKHLNNKKGGKYTGYYINGDVKLSYSDVTELEYLIEVKGCLDLDDTPIESLGNLKSVGGYLSLEDTPLSKSTTKEELRKQINVGGKIYL